MSNHAALDVETTHAALFALCTAAMDGNVEATDEILSERADRLLHLLPHNDRREVASVCLYRVRSIYQVAAMREVNAVARAAWEAKDIPGLFEVVKAGMKSDHTGWSRSHITIKSMWSFALTLLYPADHDPEAVADAQEKVPWYLDHMDRDTEIHAEDRGVLCLVENKAIHQWHARQEANRQAHIAAYHREQAALVAAQS